MATRGYPTGSGTLSVLTRRECWRVQTRLGLTKNGDGSATAGRGWSRPTTRMAPSGSQTISTITSAFHSGPDGVAQRLTSPFDVGEVVEVHGTSPEEECESMRCLSTSRLQPRLLAVPL